MTDVYLLSGNKMSDIELVAAPAGYQELVVYDWPEGVGVCSSTIVAWAIQRHLHPDKREVTIETTGVALNSSPTRADVAVLEAVLRPDGIVEVFLMDRPSPVGLTYDEFVTTFAPKHFAEQKSSPAGSDRGTAR